VRLAAVAMVRSECDIVEAFVRHNAALVDRMYVLDHRSVDPTPDILGKLAGEGLPLVLGREEYGICYQGPSMTRLFRRAVDDHPWDFVFALDADEFLRAPDRAALEAALAGLDLAGIGLLDVVTYVPTEGDDAAERDVLRRMVHRAETVPAMDCRIGKAVVPGAVIRQPGFALEEGHHGVRLDGRRVPERRLAGPGLAHFPIRSIEQFTLRTILSRLAWTTRSDYNPAWGWHNALFFDRLRSRAALSPAELRALALIYVDIYMQPGDTPHEKVLVRDPVTPAYERLHFPELAAPAVLPPILDMLDFLVDELRGARLAPPPAPVAVAPNGSAARPAAGPPVRPAASPSAAARHRFQSFWHGGPLSPYERMCLRSFVDCGHAVDLYTYDPGLDVPAGVRVRDAGELIGPDEVFVYEAEGFGKGSPSAFSNLFRYKLLAERGGWWIDTDVVCLTDRIPDLGEFFARQDADLVACGVMYFAPGHPVMARCLERATRLGRAVRWGETGPHLLTRVLGEGGDLGRALPASVCYPVHHSQALDVLRPSMTAVLAPRLESSLFLHVWNAVLVFRGVQKTSLPPRGSLLRRWADKHPVDGWTGEYDERTLEATLAVADRLAASADERRRLEATLHQQVAERERLHAQLEAMRASTSWRVTAPLRALGHRLAAWRRPGPAR
jgi:hypothetical protein